MRLVNAGAGEFADRLTILSLKLHHAEEQGKPIEHFRNEQVALLTKLKAANGIGGYVEALLELATVNGLLWRAEDEIRCLRGLGLEALLQRGAEADLARALHCAFRIQALNDRRAQLVALINQQTGEHRGDEKLND